MKKIILVLLFIFLVGCTQTNVQEDTLPTAPDNLLKNGDDITEPILSEWQEEELFDVNSEEVYRISDFRGKKVLVESFAVWCPTCTRQQKIIGGLHDSDDSLVSVSLDTDPNEDEKLVKDHALSNGFDWRYSVASKGIVQALINEFGIGVVNAPSAPVILVCEDGKSRLMDRGLKSIDELKEEISRGC